MQIDPHSAILAADGGGTRCRLALASGGARHVVTLGPANASTDLARTAATLREGLVRLAAETGLAPELLHGLPAYLGLAGVLDDEIAARLRAALPLRRAVIADDRRSALRGALGTADGALASLGTGSFLARQQGGAIRLAGGWGARLGDQASGFWIAREALAATLDTVDGLRPATPLSEALLARFGGRPRGIVAFAAEAAPQEMAALAPLVTEAAASGDGIGRAVLASGARHVLDTLAAMGWRAGEPLCLTGGVAEAYRPFLPPEAAAGLAAPQGSTLNGALALARQMAQGPAIGDRPA